MTTDTFKKMAESLPAGFHITMLRAMKAARAAHGDDADAITRALVDVAKRDVLGPNDVASKLREIYGVDFDDEKMALGLVLSFGRSMHLIRTMTGLEGDALVDKMLAEADRTQAG